jgi:hypothetical protein
MLDSQKVDSRNETSIDNSLPPVSSGTVVAKKINFNSNRVVDLSPILDQYPDMERLTIVSKGVSGVSMTKEEAQNMGKVTIGGPGVRGYYTFVVFLSDGSEIQGRL